MPNKDRSAFSLRFSNPETHNVLRVVAHHRRVSMNEIVEEAVEARLLLEAPLVQQDLDAAMETIRSYTEADVEDAFKAFAAAEVEHNDLLKVAGVVGSAEDTFGIAAAFNDFQHE